MRRVPPLTQLSSQGYKNHCPYHLVVDGMKPQAASGWSFFASQAPRLHLDLSEKVGRMTIDKARSGEEEQLDKERGSRAR